MTDLEHASQELPVLTPGCTQSLEGSRSRGTGIVQSQPHGRLVRCLFLKTPTQGNRNRYCMSIAGPGLTSQAVWREAVARQSTAAVGCQPKTAALTCAQPSWNWPHFCKSSLAAWYLSLPFPTWGRTHLGTEGPLE
jgi:hypothetical protein